MRGALNVVAVLLALSLAGCSLFMKTTPRNWEPRLAPGCSDSKTAPLVDSVVAGVGIAAASYGAICRAQKDGESARERCTTFALAPGIAAAVIYGIPALVGWHRIRSCRAVQRKHEAWLRPDYPSQTEPSGE